MDDSPLPRFSESPWGGSDEGTSIQITAHSTGHVGHSRRRSGCLPAVASDHVERRRNRHAALAVDRSLAPLAPDASNRYADNATAAALGEQIFFDSRFSSNGQVACATCHLPQLGFQDGKRLSEGVGITNRRAMPIAGMAYSPWFFWDGRKDSMWAQALGPLENPVEHGGNRTLYAHLIEQYYAAEYETVFGPLPDLSGLPQNAGPVEDPAARAAWEAMS